MHTPAFSVFSDALADNKYLIELDLRNNDINHVSGSELVSALKRNTTLRALGNERRRDHDQHWSIVKFIKLKYESVTFVENKTMAGNDFD